MNNGTSPGKNPDMQITFIRPSMTPGVARDALEPVVFAILAQLTPGEIQCRIYDERIEAVPWDEPTDLVALTVDTFSARRAYQIALHYRKKQVPVVMGGYHPTLHPEEALGFASTIVIGDAEDTWPMVIEDARAQSLKRVYRSSFPALSGLRVERRPLLAKPYRPIRLIQFGRGCPHACDFCAVHAFYGRRLRQRPVQEVIEEITQQQRRLVFFTDDNLFSNPDAARELIQALRPLAIHWVCQTSLEAGADPDLLRQMAQSGCVAAIIGFESLHPQNLEQMGKAWNGRHGDYETLIARFHQQGIMIYGTFVFGYDHDTPDSFPRCLEFALRNRLFLANFNPLAPTPGTALYTRLQQEGRLIHDPWWLDPRYRYGASMFHPRGMTAAQLAEGCYWARTEFNKRTNILARALNWRANTRNLYNGAIYFAANFAARHEIHRKQGCRLGAADPLISTSEPPI